MKPGRDFSFKREATAAAQLCRPSIGFRCLSLARARPPRWMRLPWIPVAVLLFASAAHAFGQGCAQCLDSTQATPPAVQIAYRHAIFLLGGAGAALFAAGTLLLRRDR